MSIPILTRAMAVGMAVSYSVLANTSAQAQVQLANRWSFNGNLADTSGNGNHGTLSAGSETYVAGKFGKAISLNGLQEVNHVAAAGLPTAGTADWSMNVWANPVNFNTGPGGETLAYFGRAVGQTTSDRSIANNYGRPAVWINHGMEFKFGDWPTDGLFHMVTITYTAGNRSCSGYIDGVLKGTTTGPVLADAEPRIRAGGTLMSATAYKYSTALDEFTIWSGALGQAEISNLYTGNAPAAPATPTGLQALGGNTLVVLNWTGSVWATGYDVQRSLTSGSGYAKIATTSGTAYSDTTVANGTRYYYVVSATNGVGQSAANSNEAGTTPEAGVKLDQTIRFELGPTLTRTRIGAPFLDAATASLSGLPVAFSSDNTAVATVDAQSGRVTITGVGTARIRANQAGNASYKAAPEVSQTLTVTSVITAMLQGVKQRPRTNGQAWPPADQVFDKNSLPDAADKDEADAVLRRVGALIEHLKTLPRCPDLGKAEARLAGLKAQAGLLEAGNAKREALLTDACQLRREVAFANPLLDFDRILFIKRHFCPNDEGTGNHMCDQYFGFNAIRGGGLFVLEKPFSDQPTTFNVLEKSVCANGRYQGRAFTEKDGFLAPELSFDAKQVLFARTEIADTEAGRKRYSGSGSVDNTYKIFHVQLDGSGLTQLSDGVWNDFDPCYLPSGRIMFISERRGGFGRCHGRPVPSFTLHSINADGSDLVALSPHETNEWQPSVDNNGMIVYTRWDYVDRGFNQAHHAWTTTADGRDPRAIHGNFSPNQGARPHMEMSMRAIPGSNKYMGTAACHHGQAYGSIILVDPLMADDNAMAPVKRLTPDQALPEAEIGTHGPPPTMPRRFR